MCPFKKLSTGGFPVSDNVDTNIEEKGIFVNSETYLVRCDICKILIYIS